MMIPATVPFIAYDGATVDLVKITLENRWKVYSATEQLYEIPQELHKLCDGATWLMIIDRQHPGEGYRTQLIESLTKISRYFGGLGSRTQAAAVAKLLGSWNVEKGHDKRWPAIIPVRSVMDIK